MTRVAGPFNVEAVQPPGYSTRMLSMSHRPATPTILAATSTVCSSSYAVAV
jgi:hypothetical protein